MQKYFNNIDDYYDDSDRGRGRVVGTTDYCGGRHCTDTDVVCVTGSTVRGGEGDETGQYRFGN